MHAILATANRGAAMSLESIAHEIRKEIEKL